MIITSRVRSRVLRLVPSALILATMATLGALGMRPTTAVVTVVPAAHTQAVPAPVAGGQAAPTPQTLAADPNAIVNPAMFQGLRYRPVGPHRGGRVTAISGVRQQLCTFYMGATGGGVWKTTNCGALWEPISDGQIETGSIGSIAVAESNPEIVWVGTGSAAIRSNVIIGRGVYKSTDAGRNWKLVGLKDGGQIGSIVIHPANPDIV